MGIESKNSYMEEVLQNQQVVAQELRQRKMAAPASRAPGPMQAAQRFEPPGGGGGGGEAARAVEVRITGMLWWKTVIVPPNAWVVHTRRGAKEPLHIGIGQSFRYDSDIDTFLVAPATMQTLAINAKCICKERQGILVQAYVQWIVDDFRAAYQKLDFSDPDDPMRIVNVQLREQAEASIKDKVATMSIDDVLADKRPIIEELTHRLRGVAEGQGLKIVQVQIKEAVISSTRLWENLQKKFREEQAQIARMAELDREAAIARRELEERTVVERAGIAADAETERIRREQDVELLKSRAALEETRVKAELAHIEAQKKLDEAKAQTDLLTLTRFIERQRLENDWNVARERAAIEVAAQRAKVDNDVAPARIDAMLVEKLPALVAGMPRADYSDVVHISGDGGAPDGVVALAGLVKALRASFGGGRPARGHGGRAQISEEGSGE